MYGGAYGGEPNCSRSTNRPRARRWLLRAARPSDLSAVVEVLKVEDLTVGFPTEDGLVRAVRGVSYTLHEREVLGIVGESGSGKSVSSMAVMGLLPKSARITGNISFRGKNILQMSKNEQRSLRGRKIAMIFQDPMTAMNPVYTIGFQLAEAVLSHEVMPKKAAMARAEEMLASGRHPAAEGAAEPPTRTSSPAVCGNAR